MQSYDAIIIGSGQAGNPLARFFASKGMQVAIIEKSQVGGTCVNVGCTPTKTMVASAKVAYLTRRASDFGVMIGPVSMDMEKIRARTQDIVLGSRNSNERSFEANPNIRLIRGEGKFSGPKTITINRKDGVVEEITAPKIYINTGGRPSIPKIEGLESIPYYISDTIFNLDHVPDHLIILGASYISLEFAQIYRRFGSKVTVISHGSDFLPREDEDISNILLKILEEEGIEFLFECETKKVSKLGDKIQLEILHKGNIENVQGSVLFIATGRDPNSNLNLELAGIERDSKGFIKTNEYLETSATDIYALGDVKGGPAFTHISYDDYRVIRENFEAPYTKSITGRLLNYCMFTDPELGRIGLNEMEAKKENKDYLVAHLPMTYVARAIEMGETNGMMKVIIDKSTQKILGATILAIQGGEIASTIQVAMEGGLAVSDLHNFVFAHPTMLESMNNLFAQTNTTSE